MALTKMDPDYTLSQAHPESMDLLSHAWCNFAVQTLQPETQERSLVLKDNSIKIFENDAKPPSLRMDKSARVDDSDKFVPPWKANDVKMPWKLAPFKNVSIKKWLKEIKQRRKEDQRLQKAEVHAAISVAGVAAALAAIAADNSQHRDKNTMINETAVASAAALVAAQCAKVAEAMGAKREQLSSVIGSAISGTSATIKGVDTLKARSGYKNILNGSSPVLPLEDNKETDFNFEKCRSILARGADLNIETTEGRYSLRSVAVILNNEGKVVLKMKKLNMLNAFGRQKESRCRETETGYLIVLTTDKGMIKLDMMNDYHRYRTWSMTIDHMLMLSTTFTNIIRDLHIDDLYHRM
ncbi:hypothetical protein DH2020_030626 [Rehmannia glutinosa]|uniref:VAN3-binding protein n=1 Tax=Rehmannia glutinosa TaxID=99300 RepID=A0ABR0VMP2_REHGL